MKNGLFLSLLALSLSAQTRFGGIKMDAGGTLDVTGATLVGFPTAGTFSSAPSTNPIYALTLTGSGTSYSATITPGISMTAVPPYACMDTTTGISVIPIVTLTSSTVITVSASSAMSLTCSLSFGSGAAGASSTIPTSTGIVGINTASGPLAIISNANLTTALCALTYFQSTALCTTLSAAVSPSSMSVAQGATSGAFTVTYTASGLGAAITPSVAGLPSGCTPTFSPGTVVAGGGTTSLTLACSGVATAGTSTITFGGTSGGTTSTAATASLTVTGSFSLSLGTITTYVSQSLTGSADWAVQQIATLTAGSRSWQDRKSGGTLITAGASDTTIGAGGGGNGVPAVSWTDGTNTGTGSSSTALESAIGSANGFSFTLASDSTLRTLTVLSGLGSGASGSMTVTAHSSVGGIADVVHTYTGALNDNRAFTFTMQNAGTVTVTIVPVGSFANVKMNAVKVN